MSGTEARHGIFINVEVDDAVASDVALAAKLTEVCPVDIFTATDAGLTLVEENLDECVLCNLCVEAVASAGSEGGVRIVKLYE